MDEQQFWSLVEDLPIEEAAEALETRLQSLDQVALRSFHEQWCTQFARAYRWDLWAAAYLMEGGLCSDDGFSNFRYGLISRGKLAFEAALRDPDSMHTLPAMDEEFVMQNEEVGWVALEFYEQAYGVELESPEECGVAEPGNPDGKFEWDDDTLMKQRFPRLWKRFGR